MIPSIAPIRDDLNNSIPWEGDCVNRPWSYQITAVVPVIDTVEELKVCVELLQLQTIQPFIIIIDTGSTEANYKEIEKLRSEDIEVHSIRLNGVLHPSDLPAMAMDLGFSLCRSDYLFATHSDCFLRRINLLEDMLDSCLNKSPVVGYEITKRMHKDWEGMVSHTCSMYHMKTMDKIGFGWSLRRLANTFNIEDYRPHPTRPNWPDTELLGNYILRNNSIKPEIIGKEENFMRTLDENIDHFRSYTSGKLYSHEYYNISHQWYLDARKQALERIEDWKKKWQEKNFNNQEV